MQHLLCVGLDPVTMTEGSLYGHLRSTAEEGEAGRGERLAQGRTGRQDCSQPALASDLQLWLLTQSQADPKV